VGFCFVVCVTGLDKSITTSYFFHCVPEYGIFHNIFIFHSFISHSIDLIQMWNCVLADTGFLCNRAAKLRMQSKGCVV